MKIKIKSLLIENFKGVKEKSYQFGDRVKISGMNGKGKTTIADAWFWLMADKSYILENNPSIRPDDGRECVPKVTAELDVDGKIVTIAKQQDMKTKKDKDGSTMSSLISNSYEINGCEKSATAFKSYMKDLGMDFDNFLYCSNPLSFTQNKVADMRSFLFKMANEKTDLDIANMIPDVKEAAELLKNYTFDEVMGMKRNEIRKIEEVHGKDGKLTKAKIQGMESSKVDVDVAEQELAKSELERKIVEVSEKIKSGSKVVDDLEQKKFELQFEINDCKRKANDSLVKQKRDIENQQYEENNKFNDLHQKISIADRAIAEKKSTMERLDKERLALKEPYMKLHDSVFSGTLDFDESAWVFDESSTVCSLCGQVLPTDKIEALKEDFETRKTDAKAKAENNLNVAKENFEKSKKNELERLVTDGNEKKSQIAALKIEIEELEKNLPALRAQETESMKLKNDLESKLAELPSEVDLSGNEEYQALIKKDADLDSQIASAKANSIDTSALEAEKAGYEKELDSVKAIIAQVANNVRIDEKIVELQEQWRDFTQQISDVQKIIEQLKTINSTKEDMLTDEINSHFSMTKWVLFSNLKGSGERVSDCYPTVDGHRFGKSTNTGRDIIAQLDICYSIQKFFGTYYPVFLDRAESINDCFIPTDENVQLFTLNVTEDEEMKVEV